MNVTCNYCGKPAHYVDSAIVYNGRSYGMIYFCPDCDAYVGVHKGTDRPKGSLANSELRGWRRGAHEAFDQLWRGNRHVTRKKAYKWLSKQMRLPEDLTHIGMFDVDQCKEVIRLCKERRYHEKSQSSPE